MNSVVQCRSVPLLLAVLSAACRSEDSGDQAGPSEDGPEDAAAVTADTGAEPVEAEEEEESLSFDEPYIDTILCTSCNECTNLNNRLFSYDGNKQAFIGDAAAGSFAELVKAAKLCPAKCIHPGKPRSGDATATPELIARAAEFN